MVESNRVLVVDDCIEVADSIRNQLLTFDYEVEVFYDSREALDHIQLEDCPYDLLILDVNLPGLDGITLARRVRRQYSVPILFVTGDVREEVHLTVQAMGGTAEILPKGFSTGELHGACMKIIGANQMYLQLGDMKRDIKEVLDKVNSGVQTPDVIHGIVQGALNKHCVKFSEECQEKMSLILTDRVQKEVRKQTCVDGWFKRLRENTLVQVLVTLLVLIYGATMTWIHTTYEIAVSNSERVARVDTQYRVIEYNLGELRSFSGALNQQAEDIRKIQNSLVELKNSNNPSSVERTTVTSESGR